MLKPEMDTSLEKFSLENGLIKDTQHHDDGGRFLNGLEHT